MKVTFRKTGARRYAVEVARERWGGLRCGSIGYDDWLPHDLVHFVAEAEFGLDGGVFGDLASGGNARIFVPLDRELVAKLWRKQRIRRTRLPDGRRSEELAAALEHAWHAQREGRPVAPELARALPLLDELAGRWHALQVGGALTLDWPRPERPRPARPAARGTRGARRASAGGRARRGARS